MFVAIEAKKRGWNLEFEEVHYFIRDDGWRTYPISMFLFQVDQVGPVHDRTYTYSLTIGAQNSDDVLVSSVSLSDHHTPYLDQS